MLDNTLIEKALSLTGKIMEDMKEMFDVPYEEVTDTKFSIEKFCYYLLSPEFIEKFSKIQFEWEDEEYRSMSARNI